MDIGSTPVRRLDSYLPTVRPSDRPTVGRFAGLPVDPDRQRINNTPRRLLLAAALSIEIKMLYYMVYYDEIKQISFLSDDITCFVVIL